MRLRTKIDIESWKRKEHFYFFLHFDEPYSSRVVHLDCTHIHQHAREMGVKFSHLYSYLIHRAANEVESFRLRIEGDELYLYDTISIGGTMLRPDETFGFSHIPYIPNFAQYTLQMDNEQERINNGSGIQAHPDGNAPNTIHYSITPMVPFTGYGQARSFGLRTGVPIITVGMMEKTDDKCRIPLSIHVHHSLVDGIHVGRYIQLLQTYFNEFKLP